MKSMPDIFIALSALAAILAAIVSLGKVEFWLAGSQWVLVAIALGVYGLYFKSRCECK